MKIFFLVLINKLITWGCKLFGKNGTQLPGYWVYEFFDKNVLTYVKYPKYVIAVTGSAGKGSTCNIIKRVLENNGYSVAFNQTGSNGTLGAVTLILNNCNFKGEFQKDILLLECDERHLKLIFTKNRPTHLVITNITRDQPSRNGTPEEVIGEIKKIINDDIHLVINADDPLLNRLKISHHGKITTYGLGKTKNDITRPKLHNVDFAYCPLCHKKLNYSYYHYGHLGNYECPNHDFSRGIVDYEASNIDLNKGQITIDNNILNLEKNVIYEAYAITCAYATCRAISMPIQNIVKILDKKQEAKRGKTIKYKNRLITMLETKNENNLSYYQSLRYIKNQNEVKTIILGFDNVSRRYKYNDLSWLWDVEFELLNDKNIDKIFIIGRFRYDVLTRLSYANINPDKLVLIDNLNQLLPKVTKESSGNIYTMVCFDMTANILKLIEDDENGKN